ncbi:hypothetical protein ACFLZZ_00325 [Nanoarchaeota archaeon]
MGKLAQLSGTAYNLSDSFISPTNYEFIQYLGTTPLEEAFISIDLLKLKITPENHNVGTVQNTIKKYKKWFLDEIKKMGIDSKDIKEVKMAITSQTKQKENIKASYYKCAVTIKAKDKEYFGENKTSYVY